MGFSASDVVPFTQARANLSELADQAKAGAEKIITKNGESYVALIDADRLDYYHRLERERIHLLLIDDARRGLADIAAGRSFEADGLDATANALKEARENGDEALAGIYEAQLADEVLHVRYANEYIRRQLAASPRVGLKIAAGLDQGARAFEQVFADGGMDVEKYGVAVQARLEAGFSAEEVDVAVRMSDERRAKVRARLGVSPDGD